ncbi:MAG TPA: 50S ribosomal protein L18 [Candidatus Paceibacterota bacterium]
MNRTKKKNLNQEFRRRRNRGKILGTAEKPRLSVFRSNKSTYVQLINDFTGTTLASASTQELKAGKVKKIDQAKLLGELIAEKAKKAGITQAIFNKGAYLYHGRVKAVAEGARSKGLKL